MHYLIFLLLSFSCYKQSKLEELEGRKTINALNKNNKKIILSINCETKDLDVRIPGRQWRGWIPAKEEFESFV